MVCVSYYCCHHFPCQSTTICHFSVPRRTTFFCCLASSPFWYDCTNRGLQLYRPRPRPRETHTNNRQTFACARDAIAKLLLVVLLVLVVCSHNKTNKLTLISSATASTNVNHAPKQSTIERLAGSSIVINDDDDKKGREAFYVFMRCWESCRVVFVFSLSLFFRVVRPKKPTTARQQKRFPPGKTASPTRRDRRPVPAPAEG